MKGLKNKKDIDQDYISLQDAAIICSYSQEYLSLRARQGKLKAVKFGRNWVTTKDWLQEYLRTIDDYNVNHVSDKVLKKKLKVKAKSKKKSKKPKVEIKPKEVISLAAPPANLPVSQFPNIRLGKLRPAFVATLTLVLIVAGGVFGSESFIKTYNDLAPILENANKNFERNVVREFQAIDQVVVQINRAGDLMIEDAAQGLVYVSQDIESVGQSMSAAVIEIKSLPGFFSEYIDWLNQKQSVASKWIENKISQGSSSLGKIFSGSGRSLSSLSFAVNKFVEDEIFVLTWIITDGDLKVNNFFEKSIALGQRGIKSLELNLSVTNNFIKEKIVQTEINVASFGTHLSNLFKGTYQFILNSWKGQVVSEELEELKMKIKELEKNRYNSDD